MRLFIRRTLQIAAVSGGLWALGAGFAQAEEPSIPTPDTSSSQGDSTSGDDGVLSGNQINPDVHAPITICGNAVAVLGEAQAHCQPDQSSGSDDGDTTSGDNGTLSGNQINPDVHAPITVCGNAVGVLGEAKAECSANGGNGDGDGDDGANGDGDGDGDGDDGTSGDNGNGSGNQINPDVVAPIVICGNAVGDAKGDCPAGGAAPGGPGGPGGPDGPGVPGMPPQGPPQPGQPAGGGPSAAGPGAGLAQTGASAPFGLTLLGLMFLLTGFGALRVSTRRTRLARSTTA